MVGAREGDGKVPYLATVGESRGETGVTGVTGVTGTSGRSHARRGTGGTDGRGHETVQQREAETPHGRALELRRGVTRRHRTRQRGERGRVSDAAQR